MGSVQPGSWQLREAPAEAEVGVCGWHEMVAILQGREPRSRGMSAVESHCQDRDWEQKSVCNSDLQSVVTSCMSMR